MSELETVSTQDALASIESDSTLSRQQDVGNFVTTDTIVISIIHANQRLDHMTVIGSTDNHSQSGGIVRSIASIHQIFQDVVTTCEAMQSDFSSVADLRPKIEIQQVAFDNCCKLLLITAAKSRQDVDNMIEDPGHPIWKDALVHQNLDKVMSRFYCLCLEALEHFQESLHGLNAGLQALRGPDERKGKRSCQQALKRSQSPTLSTAESFPELIQNLRDYNDIFCTLISQAVPRRTGYMLVSSPAKDLGCPYPTEVTQASQRHFGCIQRASQVLYDTLCSVWTCRDHEAHSLNVSLKFGTAKAGAVFQGRDFRFNVVVTSPQFDGQYRLVVHSAHHEFCACQMVGENSTSKKTYLGNKFVESDARTKYSDYSELDADTAAHRAVGQGAETFKIQDRVPDLGFEEDLCGCLRKVSTNIELKQRTECSCLGYLNATSGWKMFFTDVLGSGYQTRDSHSLDEVLLRANIERRTIPVVDRLQVASFMAAGVLRLNTSSWLPPVWSSKDIHFFDMDDGERCTLGAPFLRAQMDKPTTCGPVREARNPAATRSRMLSLGLVLIELAFSTPWRKLQLREDITRNLTEWEGDFLNLIRLSEIVSRELGSRYAQVVQTCLFQGLRAQEEHGPGTEELDEIMFHDIVTELDHCLSVVNDERGA